MSKKMTKQDLRNYIISEATKLYKIEVLKEQKNSIDKELKMLSEQWNPDDNYMGDYFIATAPMDEPGEAKAHVIGNNEIQEYEEAGWDIGGPYDKQTAELKYDKIMSANKKWRYHSSNQHDDRSDFDLGNLHDFDRGDF